MSLLITSGGVVTLGGGVPRQTPPYSIEFEHDGLLVDSFVVSVDGTEYDLGALTPTSGTTYHAAVPASAITPGTPQDIVIYAVNENGRSASLEVSITW